MRTKPALALLVVVSMSLLAACGMGGGDDDLWPLFIEDADASLVAPMAVTPPYPAEVDGFLSPTTDIEDAFTLGLPATSTVLISCGIYNGSTPTIRVYTDKDDALPAFKDLCSTVDQEPVEVGTDALITISEANPSTGSSQYFFLIEPSAP